MCCSFLLNFWKFHSCKPFEVHLYWHLGLILRASFYLAEPLKLLLSEPVEPAPCSRACADVFIVINSVSKTSSNHQSYHLLGEQSEFRTSIKTSIAIVFLCFMSAVKFVVCPTDRLHFWPFSWAELVIFIWAVAGNQAEVFLMWVAVSLGLRGTMKLTLMLHHTLRKLKQPEDIDTNKIHQLLYFATYCCFPRVKAPLAHGELNASYTSKVLAIKWGNIPVL